LTSAPTPRRRLALLHYAAPPITGGVESVLAAHARLLREAGHDVRVVAGRGEAELVPELDSRHPGVEQIAHRLAEGDAVPAEFAALRVRIGEQLRPLVADRDVVVAHNVMTMPFNLPLSAALSELGRPLLAWTHDLAWTNPRYADYRRPGWPWSIMCEAQRGTRYVAISRVRQREIVATLGLRVRDVPVVPNGVDALAFWGLSPQTVALVERAGLEGADPFILVPVRITRRKRLELALEAAARLAPIHPGLRLVVSGPLGPHAADNLDYARGLRHLRTRLGLDEVVTFLHELAGPGGEHPVDDRAIAELYRMADLVLLPSESEGFGLPVLEAALSRAPLVCADLAVLREAAGGDAWTFPVGGGAEAAAQAAARALASRPARFRRRVSKRYGWPAVLKRMEAVIEVAGDG
jgi:glycosyltransferase involved in cell wall biosynthesis